jgi:hypothetical protein
MKVATTSVNHSNITLSNETPAHSSWLGRVVTFDPSYQSKQDVKAGVGPEMFKGLGRIAFALAITFAGFCAVVSVAFATRSLKDTTVTAGFFGAASFAAFLLVR